MFDKIRERRLEELASEVEYSRPAFDRLDQISGLLAQADELVSVTDCLVARPKEKYRRLKKLRYWIDKAERVTSSFIMGDIKTHPEVGAE
jgi:hypothetical protein